MKKTSIALIAGLALSGALMNEASAAEYKFDPGHTEVRFIWNHAGLSDQAGEWKVVDGTVDFDPNNVAGTKVSVSIQADSVDTGVKALDDHLKANDFFDVEKFPKISFISTKAIQTSKDTIAITGDLTIKDQKKPITLDFKLNHNGTHPLGEYFEYYQGQWVGVQGGGSLLRSEFGVGKYAPLTSDRIRLEISAELREGGWK